VSLRDAVLQGLAPDKGLYMPERIPSLPAGFLDASGERSLQEIAFVVAREFASGDIDDNTLSSIISHALPFDAPVVGIEDNVYALELFHGPTFAFKDFGARFMAGLLGHFAQQEGREVVILVATSGDTGSAVANGFLKVPGTRVIVLYPRGKVSEIQEKQFTTLGHNITALEVDGTFDDCQRLVKEAFVDPDLTRSLFLTSANSINIARLIPQSFYYIHAYAQLRHLDLPIVFAVPSGNFGNLTAGLVAMKMGLPVAKFVACTNVNDVVPEYLESRVHLFRRFATRWMLGIPATSRGCSICTTTIARRWPRISMAARSQMMKRVAQCGTSSNVQATFSIHMERLGISEYDHFFQTMDRHWACFWKLLIPANSVMSWKKRWVGASNCRKDSRDLQQGRSKVCR
jgi:threonine synthase